VLTPIVLVLTWESTSWEESTGAFSAFAVASISDYLDGKIARKYQVHSRLGTFLDPLADKVLVLGTYGVIAMQHAALVPVWMLSLIALRDIGVTAFRSWAERNDRPLVTNTSAKWKTALQLTHLHLVLAGLALVQGTSWLASLGQDLLTVLGSPAVTILVTAVTVYTGLLYARQAPSMSRDS
jgi:CDP-diacylglycerol--glycerol-3-phosphate 3-phosphatidyltransferase